MKSHFLLKQIWNCVSKCLDINKFAIKFGNIFSIDKAKNAGIALVLASIFNAVKGKKSPKFCKAIFVQALNIDKFIVAKDSIFYALPIAFMLYQSTILSQGTTPLLTNLEADECGINFENKIEENAFFNHLYWENVYHGAGVAIGDVNNDGLADVFFAGNQVPDKLYLNQGNFKFKEETTALNNQEGHYWSNGVSMVDINGDGWLDIYVSKSGFSLKPIDRRNLLYINNQDGTFTESAQGIGLADEGYTLQTTFFDLDNDGDLDAYVMNQPPSTQKEKRMDRLEPGSCEDYTDRLYRNDNGIFVDITQAAGVQNCAYGLGIVATDINKDGWMDLYVSNDYLVSDHLYINQKDGTFQDNATQFFNHESLYSMGVDIADFNNDGLLDVFTADMSAPDHYRNKANMPSMNRQRFDAIIGAGNNYQYMFNALQLNNGNSSFSEIAQLAGIANTDWSWSALWIDINNNGLKDLFITNGIKRDVRFVDGLNNLRASIQDGKLNLSTILKSMPSQKLKNYAFENSGKLKFSKTSKNWGFDLESFSSGMAYGDLDNDGDLDLIVNNVDDPPFIFKNNSHQNYLRIKLKGKDKNPFAYGAKVQIKSKDQVQLVELSPTRGYLSSSEPVAHFGLGSQKEIDEVTVFWPDGKNTTLKNLSSNQTLEVFYDSADETTLEEHHETNFLPYAFPLEEPWKHQEKIYDPFQKEVLLPHKLSMLGPNIAIGDANQDGLEDVFVCGAKEQPSQLWFQQPSGLFIKDKSTSWELDKESEDIQAFFFDPNKDGLPDLYVACGTNEEPDKSPNLQDRIYINHNGFFLHDVEALPEMPSSTGKVIPIDYDGDGDEDLLVGGLMEQQNYPNPAQSYLLENVDAKFTDVTDQYAPELKKIGMVRDAIQSDYDNDGDQDIILVGEWMKITILKNGGGVFKRYEPIELEKTGGMWHSIVAADFDKDGDDDFIVGNLGLNNKFKKDDQVKFHLFSNDFDDNGVNDIVLSKEIEGSLWPVRGRECSSEQMPFIAQKFPTFHEFASANLEEIYTPEKLQSSLHFEINEMSSIYLENNGRGSFALRKLPIEAQFSVINDMLVEDFDKDGNTDLIIVGNKYETEVETARYDAGIGLYLQGDGNGNLNPIPAAKSGLYLRGNMRSIKSIEIKGQQTILISSNNDRIRAFTPNKFAQ